MVFQSEDRIAGIFFLHKIQSFSSNKSIIQWLQPIHHINICTKPWSPMKAFLMFSLPVQVSLTLIHQILVDSVNFIAHTCIKKSLFTDERNFSYPKKVTSIINSIQSKFWSLPRDVSKVVVLHTGLNAYRAQEVLSLLLTVS